MGQISRCEFGEVTIQEHTIFSFREFMVVRKIRQVEKDISHPCIFPVEDVELIGEEEITVEQIIVTGFLKEMMGIQCSLCIVHLADEPIKVFREGDLVPAGNVSIIADHLKWRKHAGDSRQGMNIV